MSDCTFKQRENLLQSSHEEAQQTCILNKSRELEMTKSKSQLERVGDQLQAAQAQLQIAQARLLESEREEDDGVEMMPLSNNRSGITRRRDAS